MKFGLLALSFFLSAWTWKVTSSPSSPGAAILALIVAVALEQRAVPLLSGYFSPSVCVAITLAGSGWVGLGWTILCIGCGLCIRIALSPSANGPLADFVADFLPATVAAMAVAQLGLLQGAPLYLAAGILLPGLLSIRTDYRLDRSSGRARKTLLAEHVALTMLGPTAVLLGRVQPLLSLLILPSIYVLLKSAQSGLELTVRRAKQLEVTHAKRELDHQQQLVSQVEVHQQKQQRLLDARAEAFALLEALSAQPLSERQALDEALVALRERLPGSQCAFWAASDQGLQVGAEVGSSASSLQQAWSEQRAWVHANEAAWPVAQRGLVWVRCPVAVHAELQQTLSVFFRYLNIMLERVRSQQRILEALETESRLRQDLTVAVMRLRALLGGASELSKILQPREILELALERVAQWTQGRTCRLHCAGLTVGEEPDPEGIRFSLGGGELHIAAQGLDESEIEALHLWAILVGAALDRCQAQAQLHQGSKLAAIGQLAAGMAHELNTPLGAISVAVGVAVQSLEKKPERALSRLELARKAIEQMRAIVAKLLNYSRDSGGQQRRVDLSDVLQDSAQMVDQTFQLDRIQLQVHAVEAWVLADAGEIQQVLVNLLVNARHAVAGRDNPKVVLRALLQSNRVQVEVHDNGPGVEEEIAERIFEPFFTTRDVGHGVGLGLSISREIMVHHGGELDYRRSELGGACFWISLPLDQS